MQNQNFNGSPNLFKIKLVPVIGLAVALWIGVILFVFSADPRFPLPETPSQVWQNDLDLRDANRSIRNEFDNLKAAINIDDAGIVTKQYQPSFQVRLASDKTNITGDNTAYTITSWGDEIFDINNDFTGGTFSAPVDGTYLFTVTLHADGISVSSHTFAEMVIATSNRNYGTFFTTDVTSMNCTATAVADMDMGDTATVSFQVNGSTKTIDLKSGQLSYWSGALLH